MIQHIVFRGTNATKVIAGERIHRRLSVHAPRGNEGADRDSKWINWIHVHSACRGHDCCSVVESESPRKAHSEFFFLTHAQPAYVSLFWCHWFRVQRKKKIKFSHNKKFRLKKAHRLTQRH